MTFKSAKLTGQPVSSGDSQGRGRFIRILQNCNLSFLLKLVEALAAHDFCVRADHTIKEFNMKDYLDPIFDASNEEGICQSLQTALNKLETIKYLDGLPEHYQELAARTPIEIQDWFDKMKVDEQAEEEGNLKEVFGLFDAALRQLRRHGFHRET